MFYIYKYSFILIIYKTGLYVTVVIDFYLDLQKQFPLQQGSYNWITEFLGRTPYITNSLESRA